MSGYQADMHCKNRGGKAYSGVNPNSRCSETAEGRASTTPNYRKRATFIANRTCGKRATWKNRQQNTTKQTDVMTWTRLS
eukprot:6124184-Amphidinium_carterae.1